MRRNHAETIPQLLVREEELFVELQNALKRARADRIKTTATGVGTGEKERDPSVSPSRSPQFTARRDEEEEGDSGAGRKDDDHPGAEGGFFEDELRGYRLLKAAKLSASERQHILTLTKNSTHFVAVRRALRTLFAEETTEDSRAAQGRRVWWAEGSDEWPVYHMDDENYSEWSKPLTRRSTGVMSGLGMRVPRLGSRNGLRRLRRPRRTSPTWEQHAKVKDTKRPMHWLKKPIRHLPKPSCEGKSCEGLLRPFVYERLWQGLWWQAIQG